jgi:Protein of unknown function (DUF4235)
MCRRESSIWRMGRLHGVFVVKIFYVPFAIVAGLIAKRLGRKTFKAIWAKFDDEDPPKPTREDQTAPKVVGAAALEAATMAGVAALMERGAAKSFHYLTGFWPGDRPDEDEEKSD